MDTVEKIEKIANNNGWYFRKWFPSEPCSSCGKTVTSGFVLSPGMNYPLCVKCAEKEFQ